MSNRVGSSTIYSTILPNNTASQRIHSVKLSRKARHRLAVIEYYLRYQSVALTCRHFGICRSYFYKWYKRYNARNLSTLEAMSRRPHCVRAATYSTDLVRLIRKLRADYPRMSAKKLAVVLLRDYGITYSAATLAE